MISGSHPWRYAMTKDRTFLAYLNDPDFLYAYLPISKQASRILQGIFVIDPKHRTSLSDLRRQILAVDTFFKTESEITAVNCARYPPAKADSTVASGQVKSPRARCEDGCAVEQLMDRLNMGSNIGQGRASASEPESDGPITPPSNAVEPEVEVPEMLDGQNIGRPLRAHLPPAKPQLRILLPTFIEKRPRHRAPGPGDKPPPRRSQFLKRAVQRLKMISSSRS